jgi:hypothetical protein
MIIKSIVLLFMLTGGPSDSQANQSVCPIDSATNGQTITLHGKVAHAPHDMTLEVEGCKDSVVLIYADNNDGKPLGDKAQSEGLTKFRKYTSATKKKIGDSTCLQCPKYEVEATLTGALAVASVPPGFSKDNLGFLHDASGKVVGKVGFGHPVPLFKYQLAIESASDVVTRLLK